MRRLATLAVVAALISPPTVASGPDYSFGDWARDQGYELGLGESEAMRELNLEAADFSSLLYFDVGYSVKISSVSLRNAAVNQTALAAMFYGGSDFMIGIQDLNNKWHRITEMDLSGIDFANITDLRLFYGMDDLTDLWLVNTANLDATDLDVLLGNLETIEGTDAEGILHMTQADFDAFNTAGGGLLAAWNAAPGHHENESIRL
jgi:hypothetical protein